MLNDQNLLFKKKKKKIKIWNIKRERERELKAGTNLHEDCFDKPPRKSGDVCSNNFEL